MLYLQTIDDSGDADDDHGGAVIVDHAGEQASKQAAGMQRWKVYFTDDLDLTF